MSLDRNVMTLNATESVFGHECNVVVENDTPHEIEQIVVIHKHSGVTPPTHMLVWGDVPAGATTATETLQTKLSHGSFGREDWWLVTWRFKANPGSEDGWNWDMACPHCQKEDGTCETYVTEPDNFFSQLFLDPMTYVKTAVMAANVAISAATLGAGVVLGASLGGLVTESAASMMLDVAETTGFKDCAISYTDVQNALDNGIPLKIVISQPSRMHAPTAQINFFELNRAGHIRKTCKMTSQATPCDPPPLKDDDRSPDDVFVSFKNAGSARIKNMVIVHKFNGLRPRIQVKEWPSVDLEPGGTASAQLVSTVAGFSFRNDWWLVAWQEDSNSSDPFEACLVRSTISNMKSYDPAKFTPQDIIVGAATAAIGSDVVSNLADAATYMNEHNSALDSFGVNSRIEALLGHEVLQSLKSRGDSTDGLAKCNLGPKDVEAAPRGSPVVVHVPSGSADGEVAFKLHGEEDCHAKALPLRCLQTEQCLKLKACQELS